MRKGREMTEKMTDVLKRLPVKQKTAAYQLLAGAWPEILEGREIAKIKVEEYSLDLIPALTPSQIVKFDKRYENNIQELWKEQGNRGAYRDAPGIALQSIAVALPFALGIVSLFSSHYVSAGVFATLGFGMIFFFPRISKRSEDNFKWAHEKVGHIGLRGIIHEILEEEVGPECLYCWEPSTHTIDRGKELIKESNTGARILGLFFLLLAVVFIVEVLTAFIK